MSAILLRLLVVNRGQRRARTPRDGMLMYLHNYDNSRARALSAATRRFFIIRYLRFTVIYARKTRTKCSLSLSYLFDCEGVALSQHSCTTPVTVKL